MPKIGKRDFKEINMERHGESYWGNIKTKAQVFFVPNWRFQPAQVFYFRPDLIPTIYEA